MMLEENNSKETLTIILMKRKRLVLLSIAAFGLLSSILASIFDRSSFGSSIELLEEVWCWFMQKKLGKNRGKSSWGRIPLFPQNQPFYRKLLKLGGARRAPPFFKIFAYLNGRNAVQGCTTFPCLRAVIWKHPRGARRA